MEAKVITETPVVFEQPDLTPSYNDKDINKHFIIGKHVIVPDDASKSLLRSLLKSTAADLEKIQKEKDLTEPIKLGFSSFESVNQFTLMRIDDNAQFLSPEDRENFISVECISGKPIMCTFPEFKLSEGTC
jgi:hypothetical protein